VESTTFSSTGELPPATAAGKGQALINDAPQREIVIRPATGWQLLNLREIWHSRELLYFLIWRDVKVRYKQTLLGAAWAVLQPTMMMIVFTVFFGRIAKLPAGNLPYPIFVFAGLLPWTFFSGAISQAGNSVVGSERLITKIYFPRLMIPFAAVGSGLMDFLIAFVMLLVLMLWYHVKPGAGILLVPVLLLILMLAGLAVGTFLSALNVAYRDFKYTIPFLTQLWMFATPSVYMELAGKESSGRWVWMTESVNPITPLIASFRAATLGGHIAWESLAISTAIVIAGFLGACLYFRRVEDSFADII
jgi:lipopolysaccharide transport system permease protein